MSGVPHGSVLGPILCFNIYINDLEDDTSSTVLTFADDTNVFRKVTNDTDKQSLQDDLDKLVKWSQKGVTFNADMKVSEQCGIAASKGNQILGLIRRTIMYKEKKLIVPLYKTIIIPH